MAESKPDLTVELVWSEQFRFGATAGANALVIDGDGATGASPMQMLAVALAGCMASDVVSILQKGRHGLTGLRVSFAGERAAEMPRRFVRLNLHFHVRGPMSAEPVERAIALSRDKYCSVWHSLRPDTEFTTTFDIHA